MTSESRLKREVDGKEFRVTFLAHWSDITSDDGETDSVKWYGPGYVSANKGHTYQEIRAVDKGEMTMEWEATHEIRWNGHNYTVMLCAEPGPAYTKEEWDTNSPADFEYHSPYSPGKPAWTFQGEMLRSARIRKL